MKSQILHTVWCDISGEAAGKIWNWLLRDEYFGSVVLTKVGTNTEDQWRSFERQLSSIHSHRQKPERSKPQQSDILRRYSALICLLLVAHFFCHQPNAVTSDSRMSFNIQCRLRLLWQRLDAWNMSGDCVSYGVPLALLGSLGEDGRPRRQCQWNNYTNRGRQTEHVNMWNWHDHGVRVPHVRL